MSERHDKTADWRALCIELVAADRKRRVLIPNTRPKEFDLEGWLDYLGARVDAVYGETLLPGERAALCSLYSRRGFNAAFRSLVRLHLDKGYIPEAMAEWLKWDADSGRSVREISLFLTGFDPGERKHE